MGGHERDVMSILDAMLDQAQAGHPGGEWQIAVPEEQAMRVPVHSTKLWREVHGRMGYYAGHVYRDCLVDVLPLKPWFLAISPVDDDEPDYYGDLRTGAVTTAPPADAYYYHGPKEQT